MALTFTLSEFGRTFATRERGAELRELLQQRAAEHEEVVIDLAQVTNVSYSFADEFLGKLFADDTLRVRQANATERVARIADRAIRRRTGCAVAG